MRANLEEYMQTAQSDSLWDRVQKLEALDGASSRLLIPVCEASIYQSLVAEMARAVAATPAEGLLVVVDAGTAGDVAQLDSARTVADAVFVCGEPPLGWGQGDNLIALPDAQDVPSASSRFFLAHSNAFSFAVVAQEFREDEELRFDGAWTTDAGLVRSIAELALPEEHTAGIAADPPVADPDFAMRAMTAHAQQFAEVQRHVARDKSDLSSVLEILKAISSRRRSHDVLYVFVEQIARVVDTQRCSVVRVWGGDDKCHVLASHEDESINDLVIDIDKYPELRRALETREKVVIRDSRRDPLTREYAEEMRAANIHTLMVIPIVLFDPNVGSLFLRVTRQRKSFTRREIGFCEIVAEAAANALERAQLFESIQKANERLELLATTDALTGLYNRRFFRERLEEEFLRARRYDLPLSCMIFDIDDFKLVNDTHGHIQGDTVLCEIAQRTARVIRKSDLCARYGGEEFVVLMPQTGRKGARAQAERLRVELGEKPYSGMPEGENTTVSIGVTVLDHAAMADCDSLIRVADEALYEAKGKGKNQVVVGTPEKGDTP